MNLLFSILAISLVVFPSKACPSTTTVTTPAATPTPTPAPTPAPTTTAALECPIGGETSKGKTCVSDSNILRFEFDIANVLDCNAKCAADADKKCKAWSFVPKRKFCILLSDCDKPKDEEGIVSGAEGCEPPSKSFTVYNLVGAELTDCVAKWEPTDVCPDQDIGTDKKIPKDGKATVIYFAAPPSIGCTKLLKTTLCKWGNEECKLAADIDVPIPNLYVKKTLADPTKCEIADNYKVLSG